MTEIEEKIYASALKVIPEARDYIKKLNTHNNIIFFPFHCDGCYDTLIYDNEKRMFTKITYLKGVGQGRCVLGKKEFSKHFDNVVMNEIIINIKL